MDETVARLNIEHLRKELERETDAIRRESLLRRIAEEEAKLEAAKKHTEARTQR